VVLIAGSVSALGGIERLMETTTRAGPQGEESGLTWSTAMARAASFSRRPGLLQHAMVFGTASLVALALNGVNTFMIPRLLNVEGFGIYRMFVLYASFLGVFHFGYLDGVLLRWSLDPDLVMQELRLTVRRLFLQQAIVLTAIVTGTMLLTRDPFWRAMALALGVQSLISNWWTLGHYALQSRKRFGQLAGFTVALPLVVLLLTLGARAFNTVTATTMVVIYIVSYLLTALIIWITLWYAAPAAASGPPPGGWVNVRMGWSILLANVASAAFVMLDRFAVSAMFDLRSFAIYSLAATALAIVHNLTTTISRVVFTYLASGTGEDERTVYFLRGQRMLILLWASGLVIFFPMSVIIEMFLPSYVDSVRIIRYLALGTGFAALVQIMHSSYFRVLRRQGAMLTTAVVGMICTGAGLWVASKWGSLLVVALVLNGGLALWWILGEETLRTSVGHSRIETLGNLGLYLCVAAGFVVATSQGVFWGGLIYIAWVSVTAILLFRLDPPSGFRRKLLA
jgi:O-antigen/teichoic acid export membrane protein